MFYWVSIPNWWPSYLYLVLFHVSGNQPSNHNFEHLTSFRAQPYTLHLHHLTLLTLGFSCKKNFFPFSWNLLRSFSIELHTLTNLRTSWYVIYDHFKFSVRMRFEILFTEICFDLIVFFLIPPPYTQLLHSPDITIPWSAWSLRPLCPFPTSKHRLYFSQTQDLIFLSSQFASISLVGNKSNLESYLTFFIVITIHFLLTSFIIVLNFYIFFLIIIKAVLSLSSQIPPKSIWYYFWQKFPSLKAHNI